LVNISRLVFTAEIWMPLFNLAQLIPPVKSFQRSDHPHSSQTWCHDAYAKIPWQFFSCPISYHHVVLGPMSSEDINILQLDW